MIQSKKGKIYFWSIAAFLSISSVVFFYWLLYGRFYVATDDAYVHGNPVRLTPQISGIVTAISVNETDLVQEGQWIVELDRTDVTLALEASAAHLASTVRKVSQMFERVDQLSAEFERTKVRLAKAEIYYFDRVPLKDTGAISSEEYVTAETDFFEAKALSDMAKFSLMSAITAVKGTSITTHPLVIRASEELKKCWVDLQRCTIKAPTSGIIAQKFVQIGQSIDSRTPLLAIVPLEQMWVDANFKEVDLAKIFIGQPVTLFSDIYGKRVEYRGEVTGIAGGTGAVFSALPPQNATGNWIKIVQRVPVRIRISARELEQFPLRLGLSMKATVDLRTQSGQRIPKKIDGSSLYRTKVFEDQEKGAEEFIQQIIDENITFAFSSNTDISAVMEGQ